ncbi:MAG: hypothetical protein J2P21_18545 [Chloracidobacterium sp.]|nr:hypothetical protein [Chloracidobacterium sp.]
MSSRWGGIFHDIHVTYEGGVTAEKASWEVSQIAGEYFEISATPAYRVYTRNVRGLTLHNVRLEITESDVRQIIVFDQVVDAAVNA